MTPTLPSPTLPLSSGNVLYIALAAVAVMLLMFLLTRWVYTRKIISVSSDLANARMENARLEGELAAARNVATQQVNGNLKKEQTATWLGGTAQILVALGGMAGLVIATTGLFKAVFDAYTDGVREQLKVEKAKTDALTGLVQFSYDEWRRADSEMPTRNSKKKITYLIEGKRIRDWDHKGVTLQYDGGRPAIIDSQKAVTLTIVTSHPKGVRLLVRPGSSTPSGEAPVTASAPQR